MFDTLVDTNVLVYAVDSANSAKQHCAIVLEAAQAAIRYRMSFWDAQIWASAKHHGAREILSEDFSDGQFIEGIRFRNPFADL